MYEFLVSLCCFFSGHKHVRQGTRCTIKFWRKRTKNAGCQSRFFVRSTSRRHTTEPCKPCCCLTNSSAPSITSILKRGSRLCYLWALQTEHPAYQSHPVLQSCPNFQQRMLPLAVHGDGTPVIGIGKIWP